MERIHAPPPFVCHLGRGDAIYPSLDGHPVKIVFAHPGGIQQATHVANLVRPLLEGADPAADEDPKKVVRAQFVLQKILQNIVHKLKFREGVRRIVFELQLGYGGLDPKLGQVESIMALGALHVEEGSLPFLDCVQALHPGEDGARPWSDADRAAGGHYLWVTARMVFFEDGNILTMPR